MSSATLNARLLQSQVNSDCQCFCHQSFWKRCQWHRNSVSLLSLLLWLKPVLKLYIVIVLGVNGRSVHPERVFAFFCALSFFLYSTILFIYLYIFIIYLITVLFLVLTTFKTTTQDIAFLFTPMRCASFKQKDVFCENSPSADKT